MPIVEFNNNNMSTRTKFILTFVAGLVTGVILVFAFGYYVAMSDRNNSSSDNVVQMFDTPKQEIKADEFKIFQVLQDGSALASYDKVRSKEGYVDFGTVVLFPASDEVSYYDDQIANASDRLVHIAIQLKTVQKRPYLRLISSTNRKVR